jgi:endoglycosylceramidase
MSLSHAFHTSASLPYIFDEFNRVRIFHGTNMVNKNFPWYPEGLLNETNIALLASMGMNTIRLSLQWTGVEPEENAYNMTYLDTTNQIVDNLLKYGIHPFLDVHQDVMSSYFCLYDGFPKWAVDKSRKPTHEFPWPLLPGDDGNPCPWERFWNRNYFSEATGVAFQTLYEPNSDFQNAFYSFWQSSADYFKDKPILGYEIINEPWAGDIYTDPTLLLPGNVGAKNLQPMYDRISEAIRSKDPNHIIFYEPVTWGMIFNGNLTGTGFTHVPGGAQWANASVFSWHYYCWWYDPATATDFTRETCDQMFGPKVFDQVSRDIHKLGGSTMLTEWGQGCDFDNMDPYDESGNECNEVMKLADEHFMSWTDWYFGGHLQEQFFDMSLNSRLIFSRVYAQAIAGYPKSMYYNVTNKNFNLCFQQDTRETVITSKDTEIFVPFALQFPDGIEVIIQTPDILELVSVDEKKNQVVVRNIIKETKTVGKDEAIACVNIVPKVAKQ